MTITSHKTDGDSVRKTTNGWQSLESGKVELNEPEAALYTEEPDSLERQAFHSMPETGGSKW